MQIRNSFSKAFGGKKKGSGGGSMSDVEGDNISHYSDVSAGGISAPSTPTHAPGSRNSNTGLGMPNYLYTE